MATAKEASPLSTPTTTTLPTYPNDDVINSNGVLNGVVQRDGASHRSEPSPRIARLSPPTAPPPAAAPVMVSASPPAAPTQPPPAMANQPRPPPPFPPPPPSHLSVQLPSLSSMTHGIPRQPSITLGKVAIVEPPSASVRRQAGFNNQRFASPTRDHVRENPKFNEDVSRLTHATQQSLPEAVRRVTRDHWEKTLLGTEFHQAFVVSIQRLSVSLETNNMPITTSQPLPSLGLFRHLTSSLPFLCCCCHAQTTLHADSHPI